MLARGAERVPKQLSCGSFLGQCAAMLPQRLLCRPGPGGLEGALRWLSALSSPSGGGERMQTSRCNHPGLFWWCVQRMCALILQRVCAHQTAPPHMSQKPKHRSGHSGVVCTRLTLGWNLGCLGTSGRAFVLYGGIRSVARQPGDRQRGSAQC